MRPLSFCVKGDKHPMEEIIVIRATDPDGSMFKAVIDALQERKVEVIMALSRPVSDGIRPAGYISDKTMRIAVQFRDRKERLNQENIMEIAQELHSVETLISKLEFHVSQLDPRQAEVIQKYYFEGKTWGELQQEMHLSPRTLIKRRDEGLEALVDIYEYLGQVTKGGKQR